ncbi:putative alpha-L-arabinofuranosidase C [Fusarium oxysporum f. sp. albedinis]|nr:putative alpha-L-arabinofuranosidase C [Fusarium oxysporum f. sp. albedinis]
MNNEQLIRQGCRTSPPYFTWLPLISRDCCRDFLCISFPATRCKSDGNRQPYPAAKDIILIPVVRGWERYTGGRCILSAGVPDCSDSAGTKDIS